MFFMLVLASYVTPNMSPRWSLTRTLQWLRLLSIWAMKALSLVFVRPTFIGSSFQPSCYILVGIYIQRNQIEELFQLSWLKLLLSKDHPSYKGDEYACWQKVLKATCPTPFEVYLFLCNNTKVEIPFSNISCPYLEHRRRMQFQLV